MAYEPIADYAANHPRPYIEYVGLKAKAGISLQAFL